VVIGSVEMLASLGPPPPAAGARATRTRSTLLALRRRRRRPRQTSAAADRRRYRGARGHNVRRRQELRLTQAGNVCSFELGRETRPSSVGELRPHFPDSPGGPDGSGPPGPLTAGRHVTTGKCRTIHKPPPIRKREAKPKGWLHLAAAHGLPDLGTVDIRSASPNRRN
jgi:hypothetical protein